jgi:hypothetical protein
MRDKDWVTGQKSEAKASVQWDTESRLFGSSDGQWPRNYGRDLMQRVNADPRVQERKRA